MKMCRSRPFSAFLNEIPGFTHLAGHVAFNRVRTALSKPTGLYFLFSIPSGTPVGVRYTFHKSLGYQAGILGNSLPRLLKPSARYRKKISAGILKNRRILIEGAAACYWLGSA